MKPIEMCRHDKREDDGHCTYMVCPNYVSACPKHSISGNKKAACNNE